MSKHTEIQELLLQIFPLAFAVKNLHLKKILWNSYSILSYDITLDIK